LQAAALSDNSHPLRAPDLQSRALRYRHVIDILRPDN
jgi:hypothetical protein